MESTLYIPHSPRHWSEFSSRIGSLLVEDSTHVYIDTSFLMWLTKIGGRSRSELFDWIRSTLLGRIHVPIWVAHEYLKHYTNRTIFDNFTTIHNGIRSFAEGTYERLRPYIDDSIESQSVDGPTLRSEIRVNLKNLYDLIEEAAAWKKSYQHHTTDVLEFINCHTPNASSVYEDLVTVSTHGHSRLTGKIPPGFKDLAKSKDSRDTFNENASSLGANTYGDLILWKEILNHAKCVGATCIVLITNDFKNDWRMGSQTNESPTDHELLAIRKSWKPIPRPHPMLVYEARSDAKVKSLELIDSVYLGAYLKLAAEADVPAFIDVALVPEPTKDGEHTNVESTVESEGTHHVPSPDSNEEEYLFDDPRKVQNSLPSLRTALLQSRQPLTNEVETIRESWISQDSNDANFWRIDAQVLAELNHIQITSLSRELHDRSLNQHPSSTEALADITASISILPPKTAAAVYMGFLASMYLEQPRNEARIPPKSGIAAQLLSLRCNHFARYPVTVISRHLQSTIERPIYIPSTDSKHITITFDTDNDHSPPQQLSSMRLHTNEDLAIFPLELLIPTRTNPELHLASILGSSENATAETLIAHAARIYALPLDGIKAEVPPLVDSFVIPENLSFINPRDVRIPTPS